MQTLRCTNEGRRHQAATNTYYTAGGPLIAVTDSTAAETLSVMAPSTAMRKLCLEFTASPRMRPCISRYHPIFVIPRYDPRVLETSLAFETDLPPTICFL